MNLTRETKRVPSEYQSNLEMLVRVPIFTGLPLESLKLLAYLCTRETFKVGDVISFQHEVDPNAYLLIQGTAHLMLVNGHQEVLIKKFGENDFFGGLTMFYEMEHLFTLKAHTQVTCLMLSRGKFQKTLENFPAIALKVFEGIAKSIYQWDYRVINGYARSAPQCQCRVGVSML